MKIIALVEDNWIGHRPTYLKLFAKILLDLGHQVIVFCPQPQEVKSWVILNCGEKSKNFIAFALQKRENNTFPIYQVRSILNAVNRWSHTRIAIEQAELQTGNVPDLVFFTWMDSYLAPYLTYHLVDQVFPYNWSGLYFHPRELRIRQKFWSICRGFLRALALFKSPRCRGVAILDEGIASRLRSQISNKPVITFPDFADDFTPDSDYVIAQKIKQQAQGRKIVGLLGLQSKRKGILTLIRVAKQAIKENIFFVFAGQLSEQTFNINERKEIQYFVQSQPENCFFYFQRIPGEPQFNALINICDLLFAVYENFPHSSNILTKAAIFEKPVLASNRFCIAERVHKFSLGLCVEESNVSQSLEALLCLSQGINFHHEPINFKFNEYRQLHSIERIYTLLPQIINAS